ncbi:MAG TPA: nitrilase-related carbon-nitrogen hydrolase, partial [Desulfuromonadaceae bacterium]
MPSRFAVALVQLAVGPDVGENLRHAASLVEEAGRGGADVVCLPELFRSQYFCQKEDVACFDLAEPLPGPSTQTFSAIARRSNLVVVVPVFERRGPGLYHNSLA